MKKSHKYRPPVRDPCTKSPFAKKQYERRVRADCRTGWRQQLNAFKLRGWRTKFRFRQHSRRWDWARRHGIDLSRFSPNRPGSWMMRQLLRGVR